MTAIPALALLSLSTALVGAEPEGKPKTNTPSPWSDFVEKDFPFFSSVLDAREIGGGFSKDNLTPRGLVLNLGQNLWACFDTDLLRVSCLWEGKEGEPPITPEALAPGSYHVAGQKTKDGQDYLPKPTGKVWLANGIYAGWQATEEPILSDPRDPAPSPEEVGRGPLSPNQGQFKGITLSSSTTVRCTVSGTDVDLTFTAARSKKGAITFTQSVRLAPHSKDILWILGKHAVATLKASKADLHIEQSAEGTSWLRIPKTTESQDLSVTLASADTESAKPSATSASLWPQTVTTQGLLSTKTDAAYVEDVIPLPTTNPWKRNIRLADIAFLNDQGDAAAISFDGDVWLISGLKGDLKDITWKRYASGLHEPMSIVVKPADRTKDSVPPLYIFDRDGIWKLTDTNADHQADQYDMFCNLVAQTAETREFPNSMKLGPDGSLYISKGGQEGTTIGKHNGTVARIAPDGKSFGIIAYGLRQPFIGVHPKTGLVTASDQQGNYVPSTPVHIIENNKFYGHLPTIAPKEKYPAPIQEPLVWLPHPVNPSGATQVWLTDAKMGPLNDELIHVGYNRPELFRVLMNTRFKTPQAAVMTFTRELDFGPLNAQVNPADGQLYVIGFQVWGTTAKALSGLVRVRYTDKPRVLLKEVTPTDKGLLLRFNTPLDPKLATDPSSFSAERWNYKRTPEYGSPHLKLDGTTGQEFLIPSSAYLSKDGLTVLVGIPDMKAGVHQMRIGWGLKSADGLRAENTAYFSPWELATFESEKEGFGKISVDLTPRTVATVALVKPTAEEGSRLYQMIGCMACHSIDGSTVGKVGPSWRGIYGTERLLGKGGKSAVADETYLRESILNPSAKVVKGFEKFDTGMPIYAGILNDSQIESLILYIKSLK